MHWLLRKVANPSHLVTSSAGSACQDPAVSVSQMKHVVKGVQNVAECCMIGL